MNFYKTKIELLKLIKKYPHNWGQILTSDKHKEKYKKLYKSFLFHTWFIEDFSNKIKIYCIKNDIQEMPSCIYGNIVSNPKNFTCNIKNCKCRGEIHKGLNKTQPKNRKIYNTSEIIKKGWKTTNIKINESKPLNKKQTLEFLKNKNYYGKSGNRKCIKDNPRVYKTINIIGYCLDKLNKHKKGISFSEKLTFLIKYNGKLKNLKCSICNNIKNIPTYKNTLKDYFKMGNGYFVCSECYKKYSNSKFLFKHIWGDKWKEKWNKNIKNRKKCGMGIKRFIDIYGEKKGKQLYKEYWSEIFKNRNTSYSKISQELFWSIAKKMNKTKDIYFAEKNYEIGIELTQKESEILERNNIFIDFMKDKKIIEYDGVYWHDEKYDKKRDKILKSRGYDILRISSNDYNKNHKDENIVNKCILFLNGELCL